MRVAVTGAAGFVGQSLCATLLARGISTRQIVRRKSTAAIDEVAVGGIGPETDWAIALDGVETLIHCAARVHLLSDPAVDPLATYRAVNVAGTRRLAEQAAALGVRRLVFLSSVKVNGERTPPGSPFSASDTPAPEDPYGMSKWEAEQELWRVAQQTGLEAVVVRPPMVYGPGVRANFLRLTKLVKRGVPLPLGAIQNYRSLLGLDNLVDMLIRCIFHPAAAGQTFLVSDGDDLSTPELIRGLARAIGRPARLLPVPPALLRLGGNVTGRRAEIERLIDSLQVDIRHTCKTLEWNPPMTVDEGFQRAVGRW